MKLRIVLSSSPLNSPFFEDGIEVALTAADMEVETEVVLTGSFLEYVKNAFPEDIVIKKLKQEGKIERRGSDKKGYWIICK